MSALKRWLTFGPSVLTKPWRVHAAENRARYAGRPAPRGFGTGVVRVTRSGGPAAPGLFRHKSFTTQGSLIVKRKGRMSVAGKRTAKQIAASIRNLRAARKGRRRR